MAVIGHRTSTGMLGTSSSTLVATLPETSPHPALRRSGCAIRDRNLQWFHFSGPIDQGRNPTHAQKEPDRHRACETLSAVQGPVIASSDAWGGITP